MLFFTLYSLDSNEIILKNLKDRNKKLTKKFKYNYDWFWIIGGMLLPIFLKGPDTVVTSEVLAVKTFI